MRELLDIKLFSQPFSGSHQPQMQLDEGKMVAQLYARLENTISVLSDLRARRSHLYLGGTAQQLGFKPTGSTIDSIWEDELLGLVHLEDLQKKYRLELKFFQLLKSIPIHKRLDYSLITKLRMRNKNGVYLFVKHRLLYLSSTAEGNIWLALCLYETVPQHPGVAVPDGLIINTATGTIINSEQERFEALLSTREEQVLQRINLGKRSKEIASELALSIHTVNRHRQNIFQKLNVNNALEACRVAQAAGLLTTDAK
jgi:DNA-binding CsgD family transcriptional regulator